MELKKYMEIVDTIGEKYRMIDVNPNMYSSVGYCGDYVYMIEFDGEREGEFKLVFSYDSRHKKAYTWHSWNYLVDGHDDITTDGNYENEFKTLGEAWSHVLSELDQFKKWNNKEYEKLS